MYPHYEDVLVGRHLERRAGRTEDAIAPTNNAASSRHARDLRDFQFLVLEVQ